MFHSNKQHQQGNIHSVIRLAFLVVTLNVQIPLNGIVGFLHDFPFLTPECKVSTKRGQVEPLYRHIIHREYPSMAFIGLLAAAPIAVGFEDQVLYYKAYLDQKFKLPLEESHSEVGNPGFGLFTISEK